MIYWIWMVFIGFFVWVNIPDDALTHGELLEQANQRQAIALLDYADKLNRWRYQHPEFKEGVITDITPEIESGNKINHVVMNNRLYVWCADRPGLLYALKYQSRSSAMVKKVTDQELKRAERMDFVPHAIAEGSLVYYN